MHRSFLVFVFLAFFSIAAVCNGAPVEATVRHAGGQHGSDGAPAATPAAKLPGNKTSSDSNLKHGDESHEGASHGDESHEGAPHGDESHEGAPHGDESHEGASHGGQTDSPVEKPETAPGGSSVGAPTDAGNSTVTNTENENASEASSTAESGVCIAANMLGMFEAHELAFEKHVLARVLCDAAGSCATKGHIVNFKGKGMMMGSYCDIVGCKESIMEVNSPKYSRGLKVPSNSEDMLFTAFAAKYETRSEEAALSAAVHMGL